MDQRAKKRIVLLDRRCTNHTSKDVINRTAEAIATTAKVQLSRHERIRALLARAASQQAAPTRWRAPAAYGRAYRDTQSVGLAGQRYATTTIGTQAVKMLGG